MSLARVAVVGSSNTDVVVRASHIPAPGETVLGSDRLIAAGGKGANQAVAAARLGAHVTLIGRVGRDHFGRESVSAYRAEGIDTRYVVTDPEAPSGIALIVVDADGQNAIAVAPGANTNLAPSDVSRASSAIARAGVLLLQLETPLSASVRAIQIAREADTRVVLNPAPSAPIDPVTLRSLDVLTPNEEEALALARYLGTDPGGAADAARALREAGAPAVAVTCGPRGAVVADESGIHEVAAHRVRAVDTTGAGDAFNGALAVALANGARLDAAVESAQRVAAASVTREGAQPSLPTRREVEERLAEA